ncbi:hypothetical protein H0A36_23485 [Endozoicomonas sp. SM1973]|uniref:Uncharacterized protein n=1 Tax=Spartinivicinus marinus TaxID=2994442 RepID=A0A853IHT4_9GAMM|nr:hypothetical protein [Spartinivicinus marinus]MCX4025059.1 hypothetical protein [Spartinivicinus marinus]NYZ68987.1 hypothetical protein [Spartinivicinus marinus]
MHYDAGHMNFFNVDHCGLYKIGNKETYGCELGETFDLIKKWVKGRNLADTIPWSEDKAKKNISKCYCKDIYKDSATGDFLVVLWKSDTDSAGTLWGAPEDNATGDVKVVKYTNNYRGEKVIWGRPCYYWIITELNTIVSIKFDHSLCDAKLFEYYVISCINNRVQHKNRKKEYTDQGHVRISYENGDGIQYRYRFNVSLKSLNTSDVKLSELASKITHIIRRETIKVASEDERSEWLKLFDKLPLVAPKPKSKNRKIEIKAEAKPNVNEIKTIIENNALENRMKHEWDNVGFVTDNGRVTWCDRYVLRDQVNVYDNKTKILEAEKLYKIIKNDRKRYLNPISDMIDSSNQVLEEA